MSFAVTADDGRFEWKGGSDNWIQTAIGLFAQPKNLLWPSCLLRDILTYNLGGGPASCLYWTSVARGGFAGKRSGPVKAGSGVNRPREARTQSHT
jgi:hypothetical protein